MSLQDMLSRRPSIGWNDQLLLALNILGGKHTPYRVVVIDEHFRVKGVISGRRILEVLLGRRGEALKIRKGLKGVLREPVNLFLDEARNVFTENSTIQTVLQYMAENNVGYVIIVNESGIFKGVVDEASILSKLLNKVFNIKTKEIMKHPVVTVSPENTLLEASTLMVDFRVRRVIVVEKDTMVGLLTITDVLNHVLREQKYLELLLYDKEVQEIFTEKVKNVMSSNVISINPEKDVGEAVDKIVKNDISCLPVSVKSKILGVVCRIDLVSEIVKIKGVSTVLKMLSE